MRPAPAYASEAGLWLIRHIAEIAAEQRRSDKLKEARLTVNRMVALGHLLVVRHADQPSSHLGLSEAYFHVSKNAWGIPDVALVEENLQLSLESALLALTLDPNNQDARFLINARQRRLEGIRARK